MQDEPTERRTIRGLTRKLSDDFQTNTNYDDDFSHNADLPALKRLRSQSCDFSEEQACNFHLIQLLTNYLHRFVNI